MRKKLGEKERSTELKKNLQCRIWGEEAGEGEHGATDGVAMVKE